MFCSLVICVFASFAIQTHCQNAPPCTDVKLYGPNKNCYFVYDEWIIPDRMKQRIASAEPFGVGHLTGYRLAFGSNGEFSTIVPTSGEDVWGYAFLTSVKEYGDFVAEAPDVPSIAVTVKVTKKDGTVVDAKCNADILKQQPSIEDPVPEQQKPTEIRLNGMVEAFGTVGIPADYGDKIKKRFTKKP